jgi:hypothetical protein
MLAANQTGNTLARSIVTLISWTSSVFSLVVSTRSMHCGLKDKTLSVHQDHISISVEQVMAATASWLLSYFMPCIHSLEQVR